MSVFFDPKYLEFVTEVRNHSYPETTSHDAALQALSLRPKIKKVIFVGSCHNRSNFFMGTVLDFLRAKTNGDGGGG